MKRKHIDNVTRKVRTYMLLYILTTAYGLSAQTSDWVAPKSVDLLNNPFIKDQTVVVKGAKLYTQYCAICHGDQGKGNGLAGMSLNPRPTNFLLEKFKEQSDGAIYWKLTTGKPPMAPYKDILNDNQRWELVSYIRSLEKK